MPVRQGTRPIRASSDSANGPAAPPPSFPTAKTIPTHPEHYRLRGRCPKSVRELPPHRILTPLRGRDPVDPAPWEAWRRRVKRSVGGGSSRGTTRCPRPFFTFVRGGIACWAVHGSRFNRSQPPRGRRPAVLRLTEGVAHPHETLRDYVVTPELARRFEEALEFIHSAVKSGSSKATYLHGSFGAGIEAVEMACGIRQAQGDLVDDSEKVHLSDHFQSLHVGFPPRPPAQSGSLKDALEGLLDQALRAYYLAHPAFEVTEEIRLDKLPRPRPIRPLRAPRVVPATPTHLCCPPRRPSRRHDRSRFCWRCPRPVRNPPPQTLPTPRPAARRFPSAGSPGSPGTPCSKPSRCGVWPTS